MILATKHSKVTFLHRFQALQQHKCIKPPNSLVKQAKKPELKDDFSNATSWQVSYKWPISLKKKVMRRRLWE